MPLSMENVKKSGTECKMHCHSWLFLYISYDLFLSQQCRFQLNGQGERFKGRQIWQNMPLDERSPLVSLLALFKKFVPDNKKFNQFGPVRLSCLLPVFLHSAKSFNSENCTRCVCVFVFFASFVRKSLYLVFSLNFFSSKLFCSINDNDSSLFERSKWSSLPPPKAEVFYGTHEKCD